jgi:hypothetical protein
MTIIEQMCGGDTAEMLRKQTDPRDWCCATCAFLQYDEYGCVDECGNVLVAPVLIMNNDDAKTFGCKFWEAKDE